jgi:hypothetical protein
MPVVRKIRRIVRRRDSAVSLRSPTLPAHDVAHDVDVVLRQASVRAPEPAPSSLVPAHAPEPPRDPRLTAAVWHVWIEGGEPIGPVSADQLARGVKAGKVPSDASVRHETETFWGDLLDSPDVVAALKAVSVESEPPPSPSSQLIIPQYLVWVEGSEPVGPVSADQIARGIRAGKVPTDASVQRVGDLFSSDVLDEPEVIAALKLL